jgi:rubredoxin
MKKPEGIRDVLKNTKHRKPAQIYCPRCASPKIALSSSLAMWLTPKEYYCPDCGYLGIIVMELDEETQDQKEKEET